MKFRFVGVAPGLGLHDGGVSKLGFTFEECRVEIASALHHQRLELRVTAIFESQLTAKLTRCFENLADGRLPEGSLPPDEWPKDLAQLDSSGKILGPLRSVPMSYLPQSFQTFAADVQRRVTTASIKAISLLRWRAGELGPAKPFVPSEDSGAWWSFGEDEWRRFPGRTSVRLGGDRLLELGQSAEADLIRLASAGASEPIAYELVREAWGLCETNPRSSLLIAITAPEVAVKQYIASRVSAAEWLVHNLQTPDVIRVLSEYLPDLDPPPNAPDPASRLEPLPKELLTLLRKRRDQRNMLAHNPEAYQLAGDIATPERARSAVLAVRQVLFRFDVADGERWAREHLLTTPDASPSSGYRRLG